jgi:hypothetical protein
MKTILYILGGAMFVAGGILCESYTGGKHGPAFIHDVRIYYIGSVLWITPLIALFLTMHLDSSGRPKKY